MGRERYAGSLSRSRRPYVIAEIGANHNGSMRTAVDLVKRAAAAGADAVKGQKRDTRGMSDAARARPYTGEHSYAPTYGEHRDFLELTIEQHAELAEVAHEEGVDYGLSVWDGPSLTALAGAGAFDFVKVPSALTSDVSFVCEVALTAEQEDIPVMLSTGMCAKQDVDAVVEYARGGVLMHCTSAYPLPNEAANLRVIQSYRRDYGTRVAAIGASGHWRGIQLDVAAMVLGATVLERHFTLDRTGKGTDHAASLEPGGMWRLTRDLDAVFAAMGDGAKRVEPCEESAIAKLRGAR
jgi:N-acetylneuraminate synthase